MFTKSLELEWSSPIEENSPWWKVCEFTKPSLWTLPKLCMVRNLVQTLISWLQKVCKCMELILVAWILILIATEFLLIASALDSTWSRSYVPEPGDNIIWPSVRGHPCCVIMTLTPTWAALFSDGFAGKSRNSNEQCRNQCFQNGNWSYSLLCTCWSSPVPFHLWSGCTRTVKIAGSISWNSQRYRDSSTGLFWSLLQVNQNTIWSNDAARICFFGMVIRPCPHDVSRLSIILGYILLPSLPDQFAFTLIIFFWYVIVAHCLRFIHLMCSG